MSSLLRLQRHFAGAMRRGDVRSIAALVRGDGITSERRLGIHANHFRLTLVDALAATFPSLVGALGRARFAQAAAIFVRDEPPTDPRLDAYGEGFPRFVAGPDFGVGRPWLADLGRLDWAINRAYHAEEKPALAIADLAGVPPSDVERLVFALQPSLTLLRSRFDVVALWDALRTEGDPSVRIRVPGIETHLAVARRGIEVTWWSLADWEWRFLGHLAAGSRFGDAVAAAADRDVTHFLAGLLASGLLVDASLSHTKGPRHVANDDLARDGTSSAYR